MSTPTWDEYLSQTSAFLSEARNALDAGSAIGDPPPQPDGAIPADRHDEVRLLALGFEALSGEVEARMTALQERLAVMARITHPGRGVPHFVDTPL